MHASTIFLAAITALVPTTFADFSIWRSQLATAGEPGAQNSAIFASYLDNGLACADLESENKVRFASYRDVTPRYGGVSCDNCELGVDFDRYEFWSGPTRTHNAIFSQSFGYITLRPRPQGGWKFEYINRERDSSGIVTNSYCVRASGSSTCSIGVATRTSSKLFDCFTSMEVVPSRRKRSIEAAVNETMIDLE